MVDFGDLADKAQARIAANGRAVTLIKLSRTAADADKPWRATANPRATPEASVSTIAVFVDPSIAGSLGMTTRDSELVKRSEQIMICGLGQDSVVDLTEYDEVIDGSIRWRITKVEKPKPADVTLLFYVGVTR